MVKKGGSLDTLAPSGTKDKKDSFPVLENKTKKDDKSTLKKRARAKAFSTSVAVGLVEASEKSDGKKINQYWNSYHCASVATLHEDGKVTSKYCKNRWCVTCNRIRTAKVTNQYLPDVKQWLKEDAVYFVTLTAPNVEAEALPKELHRMKDTFALIGKAVKKQAERGKKERFVALRKLECTYSYRRDDFNPHIHALIKGEENAKYVLNQWLKRNPTASKDAQHLAKVTGATSLMEVFKYSTKMITKAENKSKVYTGALHEMYKAFQGVVTLQNYGFKCSNSDAVVSGEEKTKAAAVSEYEWKQLKTDWINEQLDIDASTGELLGVTYDELSGYKAGEPYKQFLNEGFVRIDQFGNEHVVKQKELPKRNPYQYKQIKPQKE